MKSFVTIWLIFLAQGLLQAQSFKLEQEKLFVKGNIGEELQVPIQIENLTSDPIEIGIRRVDQVIGSSQKSFFCWDGNCLEEGATELPSPKRLEARQKIEKFTSVLEAGLVAGISSVMYEVYNQKNPSDAVELEITYSVEDEAAEKVIYSSETIKIKDVYPNPVSEFAIVEYQLVDREIEAKVMIHNVLGSVVGEYELNYLEDRIKIKTDNYNPGVYFYSLYLDNEGVLTRKLIVRK